MQVDGAADMVGDDPEAVPDLKGMVRGHFQHAVFLRHPFEYDIRIAHHVAKPGHVMRGGIWLHIGGKGFTPPVDHDAII